MTADFSVLVQHPKKRYGFSSTFMFTHAVITAVKAA